MLPWSLAVDTLPLVLFFSGLAVAPSVSWSRQEATLLAVVVLCLNVLFLF